MRNVHFRVFSRFSFYRPRRMPGPTSDSANRKIQSIASVLRLSDVVSLAATRLYTLAVEHKFTKGRKSLNVVAVCLYVACRQKETRNYMLIDFSDLLQVKPHFVVLYSSDELSHIPRSTYSSLDTHISNSFRRSICGCPWWIRLTISLASLRS